MRRNVGSKSELWGELEHGRFWQQTYRSRVLGLLGFAAIGLFVHAWAASAALILLVVPFELLAERSHRRRGFAPSWLGCDLVLAASMCLLSPTALLASVACIMVNTVHCTIASDARSTRRYVFASAAVIAVAGVAHRSAAQVFLALPFALCCGGVVSAVEYLIGKQRASSSRFEDLLDGINAAVYELDISSGEVLFANRRSVELLGFKAHHVGELLSAVEPEDRALLERFSLVSETPVRRDAVAFNASTNIEVRFRVGSEMRFMQATSSVLRKTTASRLRMVIVDVSHRKRVELELAHRAQHDSLTELPNRALLRQRMDTSFDAPDSTKRHAVLLLDLDSFKDVNDGLGHHHGDLLLVEIANRLRSVTRVGDTVARLGGDEFAILAEGADLTTAREIARRTREAVSQPYIVEGVLLNPEVSIGIACYPDDGQTSAELMRLADTAMYRAKRSGTGFAVYNHDFDRNASDRLLLQAELREALSRGQLEPFFQPLVHAETGRIVSCEALVRWRHPRRGILTPGEFWPMVQTGGFSRDIARIMLGAVLDQIERWAVDGVVVPVSVNLSASDLTDVPLMQWFMDELRRRDLPPGLLTIELTEAELITQTAQTRNVLFALRDLGVATAVDDFGTGYSSLTWLRDLPVSAVKIDRSFVENLRTDDRTRAIVKSTIDLARDLHLEIVGEGVEDVETATALGELGCGHLQGYLYSRPVPALAMEELLRLGIVGAKSANRRRTTDALEVSV